MSINVSPQQAKILKEYLVDKKKFLPDNSTADNQSYYSILSILESLEMGEPIDNSDAQSLYDEINTLKSQITALQGNYGAINTTISSIHASNIAYSNRIGANESTIQETLQKYNALDTKIGKNETQIALNKTNSVNAVSASSENTNRLNDMVDKTDSTNDKVETNKTDITQLKTETEDNAKSINDLILNGLSAPINNAYSIVYSDTQVPNSIFVSDTSKWYKVESLDPNGYIIILSFNNDLGQPEIRYIPQWSDGDGETRGGMQKDNVSIDFKQDGVYIKFPTDESISRVDITLIKQKTGKEANDE